MSRQVRLCPSKPITSNKGIPHLFVFVRVFVDVLDRSSVGDKQLGEVSLFVLLTFEKCVSCSLGLFQFHYKPLRRRVSFTPCRLPPSTLAVIVYKCQGLTMRFGSSWRSAVAVRRGAMPGKWEGPSYFEYSRADSQLQMHLGRQEGDYVDSSWSQNGGYLKMPKAISTQHGLEVRELAARFRSLTRHPGLGAWKWPALLRSKNFISITF